VFDAALRLLAIAEAGPLEELQRAHADLLRGQIAFVSSRSSDAPPLLLKAAKRFEPLDVRLARETYLEALSAARYSGRLATADVLREAAEAARAAPPASEPPGADDLLLDGLALLITEDKAAAAPTLKRALAAFASDHLPREEAVRWLWLACPTAVSLWDDRSWDVLSTRQVQLARDAGALGVLPMALTQRAGLHLYEGDFAATESLIEEAEAIADATGTPLPPYIPLALAAFRGQHLQASELIETADLAREGDDGSGPALLWATAVLCNGLGRYDDAMAAAERAGEDREQVFATWAAVELVEAATRIRAPEHVAGALERISASTRAGGTDWALGIEARARALISEGEPAERLYREALDRLGRTRVRLELARAHLLYGEWLRREGRRVDAREQLRTAHGMFETMGAEAFAERARRELAATGETVRKRTVETRDELTPQEAQIAQLARDGHTSPEIGAQLFISPRTVEWHLRKVFAKLAINSRKQLQTALVDLPGSAAPAP
jgi:DNA-binding CsgD family transcriptional regulator